MSEKMACPGCSSYTSSVLSAHDRGEPCPYCGLSFSATAEIIRVQEIRADEKLKAALTEALKAQSAAERRARSAEYKLQQLRAGLTSILDADDPDWLGGMEPWEPRLR